MPFAGQILLNIRKVMVTSAGRCRKTNVCSGIKGGSPHIVFPTTVFLVASLPFLTLSHLTGHTLYLFLKNCHQPGVKLMLTWAVLHVGFHFFPLSLYSHFSVFTVSVFCKNAAFKKQNFTQQNRYSALRFPLTSPTTVKKKHMSPAAKSLLFKVKQETVAVWKRLRQQ